MKYACDLHIHTALSPCADDDMTPNNIINMALLKKLDIIAVTDHNSAKNVQAVIECSKGKDVLVLPGIEVNTKEDIHVLCYFADIEALKEFDAWLYPKLLRFPFDKKYFGDQFIIDKNDKIISNEEKYLLQGADVSFDKLITIADNLGGVAVPAHINREANSLLEIFGFIPKNPLITAIEMGRYAPAKEAYAEKYHVLYSSDAHDLGAILEREFFIDLNDKSKTSLIGYLKSES